jgi:hypothetical protein
VECAGGWAEVISEQDYNHDNFCSDDSIVGCSVDDNEFKVISMESDRILLFLKPGIELRVYLVEQRFALNQFVYLSNKKS